MCNKDLRKGYFGVKEGVKKGLRPFSVLILRAPVRDDLLTYQSHKRNLNDPQWLLSMKTTTLKKSDNVVRGKVPVVGTGHRPHQSGAGKHKHRCTKRLGTRSSVYRRELGTM